MAKVIYRDASEDDPIYKEGFQVSSQSYSREYAKSKLNSAEDTAGKETKNSTKSTKQKSKN
jgi:hypothetical protein